jgi:hypothetical protein
MFATNGAITIGARSTFGSIGCGPAEQQDEDEGEYQDADEGEYGYDE